MRILAAPPLRTGSVVWQEQPGQYTLTVVCKATYALAPLTSTLAEEPVDSARGRPEGRLAPEDVNERDNYWDDDPDRSLYLPSDLAPFKPEAEVILVGSAFAPHAQPVRSLFARIIVGQLDKSIEVFCPRVFTSDGALQDGPRWTQMPLRYERAAGGADSWNPVGIPADALDRYGRRALPNLQAPGIAVTTPSDVIQPVGFGPIAPTWPGRKPRLRDRAARWSDERWAEEALGEGFDGSFFQASPSDQRVDALRPDEQIVLENLHPEHPRLVTKLPGVRPRARVESPGAPAWDLTLVADTLWIDTARAICTLTWRGQVPLDDRDEPGIVRIGLEEPGKPMRWPTSDAPPVAEGHDDPDFGDTATELPRGAAAPVLPFQRGAAPAPPPPVAQAPQRPRAPNEDPTATAYGVSADARGAMPSWLERPTSTSAVFAAPRPPVPPAPPPPAPPPPVPMMMRQSDPFLGPPATMGGDPPYPAARPATIGAAMAPSHAAQGVRVPPPPPSFSDAAPPPPPRADATAAYGGVLEASNAAADPQAQAPKRKGTLRGESSPPPPARTMVELIFHDPTKVARVRAVEAWAELFRAPPPAPPADDPEAQKKAAEEKARSARADVVAVLGRAQPTLDVEAAVLDAAAEDGGVDAPFVVVSGELELGLDEVKMLEAMLGAAGSLAAGDKKLKEVLDLAGEVMRTPLGASPGVAAGLVTRVREAWSKANRLLPADYLDVHTRRLLLEQRSYQKRELWNDSFIRAVLSPAGEGSGIPTYLPASLAKQLPLFARFPARVLAEAFPQQDQAESHPVALRAAALGRVVTGKARR